MFSRFPKLARGSSSHRLKEGYAEVDDAGQRTIPRLYNLRWDSVTQNQIGKHIQANPYATLRAALERNNMEIAPTGESTGEGQSLWNLRQKGLNEREIRRDLGVAPSVPLEDLIRKDQPPFGDVESHGNAEAMRKKRAEAMLREEVESAQWSRTKALAHRHGGRKSQGDMLLEEDFNRMRMEDEMVWRQGCRAFQEKPQPPKAFQQPGLSQSRTRIASPEECSAIPSYAIPSDPLESPQRAGRHSIQRQQKSDEPTPFDLTPVFTPQQNYGARSSQQTKANRPESPYTAGVRTSAPQPRPAEPALSFAQRQQNRVRALQGQSFESSHIVGSGQTHPIEPTPPIPENLRHPQPKRQAQLTSENLRYHTEHYRSPSSSSSVTSATLRTPYSEPIFAWSTRASRTRPTPSQPSEPAADITPAQSNNAFRTPTLLPPTKQCTGCIELVPLTNFPPMTEYCLHKQELCLSCTRGWITANMNGLNWNRFECWSPNCTEVMSREDMSRIGTRELLDKYDNWATISAINEMEDIVMCPIEGCSSGQEHDMTMDGPMFSCIDCLRLSCLTHNRPWHEGETCEQFDRRMRQPVSMVNGQRAELAEVIDHNRREAENKASEKIVNADAKRCPGCDFAIQRNGGCPEMTCSKCGYKFCWFCMANYRTIWHQPTCPLNAPEMVDL